MHYEIGKQLSEKVSTGPGAVVISNMAIKVKEIYSTLKGFGKRGL